MSGEQHSAGLTDVRGFRLTEWQKRAVEAWERGDGSGHHRGTLEVFTGGGKTLLALVCFARAVRKVPGLKLAIVVPTEALAHQWRDMLLEFTYVKADAVGLLGAGHSDDLGGHAVLIAVLNSAARRLPSEASRNQPLMLVVDECHRAGAPTFSRVLATSAVCTLGLSATPEREEFDVEGNPLEYDGQLVGQALGHVVFSFDLRAARAAGWLPDYEIHHHGLPLSAEERLAYERVTREIDDIAERLRDVGVEPQRARLRASDGEIGALARSYVAKTAKRKDVLYRAAARNPVALKLVEQSIADGAERILLFNERVSEATAAWEQLRIRLGEGVELEHSALANSKRRRAIARFRTGEAKVLVSVRSLVEGLNVPEADVGISVAASSSVRQRIQTLGRVLRRGEQSRKRAWMHLLYVRETVDELVYAKEDWSDLTGESTNHYWIWSDVALAPVRTDQPPRTPAATEEMEWERLGGRAPDEAVPWLGLLPDAEYSVDVHGNVRTLSGRRVVNPQGVGEMLRRSTGRMGGRFRVTRQHRLVIATGRDGSGSWALGALSEPFALQPTEGSTPVHAPVNLSAVRPGEPYGGPRDSAGGVYELARVGGGKVARRRRGGGREFASTDANQFPESAANVGRVLEAWRTIGGSGREFVVNSLDHAFVEEAGAALFVAHVPGGFVFPGDMREETDAAAD